MDTSSREALQGYGRDLATRFNAYGIRIATRLAAENGEENVVHSPASLMAALTLAFYGANGSTWRSYLRALEMECSRVELLAQASAWTRLLSSATEEVELRSANALWAAKEVGVSDAYGIQVAERLAAELAVLPDSAPDRVAEINGWVARRTGGKIRDLLSSLPPETAVVLASALYFKGSWLYPFDPGATELLPFHSASGEVARVRTMQQTREMGYYADSAVQAVRLPYRGERFAAYLLLPTPETSPLDLLQAGGRELGRWMDGTKLARTRVLLQWPVLRLESKSALKQALAAEGLAVAFDSREANFSRITHPDAPETLSLSEVIQGVRIDVDEEGTEAAAATAVVVVALAAMTPPAPPVAVKVDRPFLFMVRDDETGQLLFTAAVRDPR